MRLKIVIICQHSPMSGDFQVDYTACPMPLFFSQYLFQSALIFVIIGMHLCKWIGLSSYTGKFTCMHGDVMLTSIESRHSPMKITIWVKPNYNPLLYDLLMILPIYAVVTSRCDLWPLDLNFCSIRVAKILSRGALFSLQKLTTFFSRCFQKTV